MGGEIMSPMEVELMKASYFGALLGTGSAIILLLIFDFIASEFIRKNGKSRNGRG